MIWVTNTVGRMSSKANCFQQNFCKTVYLVPLLCTHLFLLWFFCLPFQLVKLFTPPYAILHSLRGNDDPSLLQRCCWKKNRTKYNYYCLAGCICKYSLVNMSFGELAQNHNDQCPAWVAAQAQGCCLSLGQPGLQHRHRAVRAKARWPQTNIPAAGVPALQSWLVSLNVNSNC